MPETLAPIIFVAIPGTDLDFNVVDKDSESVKANLPIPVIEKLKAKLAREIHPGVNVCSNTRRGRLH